jgi:hypothetical protein
VPEAIPIGEAVSARPPRSWHATASRRRPTRPGAGLPRITGVSSTKIDEVRLAGFSVTNPEVMRTYLHVKAG